MKTEQCLKLQFRHKNKDSGHQKNPEPFYVRKNPPCSIKLQGGLVLSYKGIYVLFHQAEKFIDNFFIFIVSAHAH